MLASRHHSSRVKSCQLMRAICTVKASSNQKGFLARNRNRSAVAAAVSKARVSTETHVDAGFAGDACGDPPALLSTAIWEGSMLFNQHQKSTIWRLVFERTCGIPDDTMLKGKISHDCGFCGGIAAQRWRIANGRIANE